MWMRCSCFVLYVRVCGRFRMQFEIDLPLNLSQLGACYWPGSPRKVNTISELLWPARALLGPRLLSWCRSCLRSFSDALPTEARPPCLGQLSNSTQHFLCALCWGPQTASAANRKRPCTSDYQLHLASHDNYNAGWFWSSILIRNQTITML